MIAFYNAEVDRLVLNASSLDKKQREAFSMTSLTRTATQIAWTRGLKQDLAKGKRFEFDTTQCLVPGLYRPFNKQWLYFNRAF